MGSAAVLGLEVEEERLIPSQDVWLDTAAAY